MANISNTTSETVITGTAENDSITNYGTASVSIDAGDGNDSIHNFFSDNTTITGGAGDDYLNNSIDWEISRGTVYIYSSGNDTLEMFGADDNFIIIEGHSWATIGSDDTGDLLVNVLDGTETVGSINLKNHYALWGDRVKILSSKEEFAALNVIINGEDNQTLTGTDTKNVISNTGANVSITGGADNDSISNLAGSADRISNAVVDAGDGDNQIFNNTSKVTITAGNGNDSVCNENFVTGGVVYVYGGGNDTLSNFDESTFIVLGDVKVNATSHLENVGNIFRLSNGKTLTFNGRYASSIVSSLDEVPQMNITYNAESGVVVTGKQEASAIDFILNENDGNNVTINGSDNADIIRNVCGDVSINGGAGNDNIGIGGSDNLISGGAGDDSIDNWGERVSISAGAGNDYINNSGANVSINAGDGNDSIWNWHDNGTNVLINAGAGNDYIENWGENVTINAGTDDDTINVCDSTNALIVYNAGDGNDFIESLNSTSTLSIAGGEYSTATSGDDLILTVGDGKITLSGAAALSAINIDGTLSADTGADASISGGNGNDTLDSADGDNTLTGGKGNDIFVYNGGNVTITDYSPKGAGGADKISVASDLIYADYEFSGDDVILNYGDGNDLTITDGKGKAITFAGKKSTVKIYEDAGVLDGKKKSLTLAKDTDKNFIASGVYKKIVTINGASVDNELQITGNSKANYIIAGNANSTLNGGKGKDTLVGGDGADVFIYNNKSGNKVIRGYNFDDDDLISLGDGATISQVKTKSGNVIVKIGSNTITIEDTTKFNFMQDGETKIYDDGKLASGDSVTLASDFKGTFDLTADDNSDYSHVSAALVKKAVNLIGDADNNSLIGGKGSDTLWGGEGADTFIYKAGMGTDKIMDYEDGDLLQIIDKRGRTISKGAVKKWAFDGDDLTLTIKGGGKLILAGVGTSATVNVNNQQMSF